MKRKYYILSAAIALSSIALSSCGVDIDKSINKMLIEANKQCPVRIDSDTRLDKLINPGKGILEYSYTLVNITEDALAIDKDYVVSIHKNEIIKNLKNTGSKELKNIQQLNVTFRYTYHDKNGALLFSFDITPEDYK